MLIIIIRITHKQLTSALSFKIIPFECPSLVDEKLSCVELYSTIKFVAEFAGHVVGKFVQVNLLVHPGIRRKCAIR